MKYSYSNISTFEQCPFKYKLIYVDKHFINQPSIATDFGSLIHFIEETMANTIKEGKQINYRDMINLLYEGNESENIKGVDKIKELYPQDFVTPDKNGRTYTEKIETYIDSGICRLEDYLAEHPELEIVEAEKPFELEYKGYNFHGFIDRIFRNKITGDYIIEDIKTYSAPLKEDKLITPLQFVIYTLALQNIFKDSKITCAYELPLCNCKQQAGTKGFIERGIKKLDKLLNEIEAKNFIPKPTPLCYFCPFSSNNVNPVLTEDNYLCPYFCHWSRQNNKDFSVEYEWMGVENHDRIIEAYKAKLNNTTTEHINITDKIVVEKNERRFIIRH